MKSKFTWILTLCLAFFIQFSFAQEKTVTGTVVSKKDKMTIPGAGVLVQGTTPPRGTTTDFNGNFSIKVAVGQKLVFSFLGSKSQTVTVGESNTINVQLEDEATELETLVVEGYGITKTKRKSNVASTTVDSKTLEGRPNATFIQSLQGTVAGLNISSGSGQPGGSSEVILRGVGSLTGKTDPLYIIDNVPMNSDNFRSLSPDEIESVSVLKDAGATAIYGSRAASGVIVVKTKKGGFDSALKIKYTAQTGFATMPTSKYDLMNTQQLLTLERAKNTGMGAGLDYKTGKQGKPMTDDQIANYGVNTDWKKQFFRTGVTQNHQLALTSGSKTVSSYTSLGYFSQEGIVKNTGLDRFSFRSNIDGKSKNDKFNFSTNLSVNFSRTTSVNGDGGSVNNNPIIGAYQSVPYISPSEYTNGQGVVDSYNKYPTLIYTPLMLMDKMKTYQSSTDELKMISALAGSYKIAKNWTLGTNLGMNLTQQMGYTFTDPGSFNSIYFFPQTQYYGNESHSTARDFAVNWNNRLNYNKTFGKEQKHSVDATLFSEYFKTTSNSFGFNQNGLDPKTLSPGSGSGYLSSVPVSSGNGKDLYVPSVGASAATAGLFSYFAVGDYDYDGRFGFGATIRRDASSRFAESNRWGTFYSLTGRWNIDREKFMEGSIFNSLKLRGSYGTNGNQQITGSTYGALNSSRELYDNGSGYLGQPSYSVSQLGNPDLKWETSIQGNIGVDFEMMKGRLRSSVDVYNKKTVDLYQPIQISAINATTSLLANYGDMYNRGIELVAAYDLLRNKNGFNLTLKGNGSYNKNRITSIPNSTGMVDNGAVVNAVGHKVSEFYTVRYIGVNPADGNLLYLTKDGKPTENPDQDKDRVFTGKSSIPVYQGGFGFDSDYKGFFLNTQFAFAADVWRYDGDLSNFLDVTDIGTFNKSTDLQRAWTPTNRYTDVPSLTYTNTASDGQSDRFLKDASYVRMKFITFGYVFPKKMLKKTPFTMLKLYANAENMVTWSKWRGFDVEEGFSGGTATAYPTPKTVSFGLNLEF